MITCRSKESNDELSYFFLYFFGPILGGFGRLYACLRLVGRPLLRLGGPRLFGGMREIPIVYDYIKHIILYIFLFFLIP
jgi:hypothetical protein